jgi:hypothetical protein
MGLEDAMHRSLLLPPETAGIDTPTVVDADPDDHGNAAFAVGSRDVTTHVLFGAGALVPLPKPLHGCILRLRDSDRALVRGWKNRPFLEPDAYEVASDGAVRQNFLAVQSCSDFLCTPDRVVLAFYDYAIGTGVTHAEQALAIFDWEGKFQWGWNDTRDLPQLYDCDGATRLGGNLIGVYANHDYPLVVLDVAACKPIEMYYPTPKELHGAQSIARQDDVWVFLAPYGAEESALAWCPGSGRPTTIGTIPYRHHFRGLANGQFINVAEGQAEVLKITSADLGRD